jgi:Protein of unknown function (DUF1574)
MINLNLNDQKGNVTKQSCFLLALFILFAINLFGLVWQRSFNRQTGSAKSTNSLIDSFTVLQKSPNIVLLGSSLIKTPFWLSDMHYLSKTLSYDDYHCCSKLQSQLLDKELKGSSVFDFGIPGAMVSDIYLLTEKLLVGPQAPKLVIYAIGPRDLNDRVITSEITTPTFDRLFSPLDLGKNDWPYRMDFEQKVNLLADRLFFAYRKRSQWQMSIASGVRRGLDILSPKACPKPTSSNSIDFEAINTNNYKRYAAIAPEKQNEICWNWSIKDYRARYANFNSEQFSKQLFFLKSLIATTKKRNIALLLVNMPLTPQNLELMPSSLYPSYIQSLRTVANSSQIPLIDLQNDRQFDQTCFYDTVHLNSIGGDRLSSLFSKLISNTLCQANSKSAKLSLCETTQTQ